MTLLTNLDDGWKWMKMLVVAATGLLVWHSNYVQFLFLTWISLIKTRYENPYACLCLCSNWWSKLIPAPSEDPPFAFGRCQTAASAEDPEETAGAEAHLSFAHRCPGQKGRGGHTWPWIQPDLWKSCTTVPSTNHRHCGHCCSKSYHSKEILVDSRVWGFDIAQWTSDLDCAFVCRFKETGN